LRRPARCLVSQRWARPAAQPAVAQQVAEPRAADRHNKEADRREARRATDPKTGERQGTAARARRETVSREMDRWITVRPAMATARIKATRTTRTPMELQGTTALEIQEMAAPEVGTPRVPTAAVERREAAAAVREAQADPHPTNGPVRRWFTPSRKRCSCCYDENEGSGNRPGIREGGGSQG
jgi:hypothetical protein